MAEELRSGDMLYTGQWKTAMGADSVQNDQLFFAYLCTKIETSKDLEKSNLY